MWLSSQNNKFDLIVVAKATNTIRLNLVVTRFFRALVTRYIYDWIFIQASSLITKKLNVNPLRNLKLKYRFVLLLLCVVTGFICYGIWSFKTLYELKVNGPVYSQIVQGKDLVADILPPPEYIIESYLVSLQLFSGDKDERIKLIDRLKTLKSEYDIRHTYWENEHLTDDLARTLLIEAHGPATEFYDTVFKDFLPALQAENNEAAFSAMSRMKTYYELHRKAIDKTVISANNRVKLDESHAKQQIDASILLMLGILVAAVLLTAGLTIMISRSVLSPLVTMQGMMLEIKNSGDFTRRLEADMDDEVSQTAKTFNELIKSIQFTLLHLLDSAEKVSYASHDLTAAAQQVAASSGLQSSAATAIAAAITQVNTSINTVTQSANQALDISCQSGNLSNQGGEIIHNAATAMMQIAETVQNTSSTIEILGQQSNQISSVVQVIKDVADQTNLLALNAAIEAARAGEQGRGFAVVADEVRNLAKRTTNATEEISQMIRTMQSSADNAIEVMGAAVDKADGGVVIARQAGEAVNQIKAGSSRVVDVVNNISTSLVEQNKASNNISNQVGQVAQMAEEYKASAMQTANAAKFLEELAVEMRNTVSKFTL